MRAYRRALRRTYLAFYAHHNAPNILQLAACNPILKGENALIVAPTATGKTEAALAPIVERRMSLSDDNLRILYVAPTRALCRDMGDRMKEILGVFKRKVLVRTGDSPNAPDPPPFMLVTTLESLDSLLARAPTALQTVQTVVLDEIHAVHGNARGDQLMVLLQRLDALCQREVQRVALSATIADPDVVVSRYLGEGQVIVGEGRRATVLKCVPDLAGLLAALREQRLRRVLCFAETRAQVEEAAAQLLELMPGGRILVHHAGLSARSRHEVEESMRTFSSWLCVATSTLELGIDVGTIEAVALLQVPVNPSAFQQRIGRGARRDSVIRVLGVAETDERKRQLEMHALFADRGELESVRIRVDPGVAVQQIFSILFSRPSGVEEDELLQLLRGLTARVHLKRVIDHLVAEGHIRRERDTLLATTRVMDLGRRGTVHANLPDSHGSQVFDSSTGRMIGNGFAPRTPGSVFVLGGRSWKVQSVKKNQVLVVPHAGADGTQKGLGRSRGKGPWDAYLPAEYRTGFEVS